ncbi:DNA polymerase subunit gamma-1, mitochondrial [Bacillus rossius redtenbacheri]|uniref:DNA polymerase subunit gamma-1, mitochondrial n=1 Tax=Bacillus rossius redtenbacheri TaxID=93214 RepID=UPI002FDCE6CA
MNTAWKNKSRCNVTNFLFCHLRHVRKSNVAHENPNNHTRSARYQHVGKTSSHDDEVPSSQHMSASLAESFQTAMSVCEPYSTTINETSGNPLKERKILLKRPAVHVAAEKKQQKVSRSKLKKEPNATKEEGTDSPRFNEINIQMLSSGLFKQLFGNVKSVGASADDVTRSRRELEKYGLLSNELPVLKDVDLKLPPLQGGDLEEHFRAIGQAQVSPYTELLRRLVESVPAPPEEWRLQAGWTRYSRNESPEPVPFPRESGMVLDVEVCRSAGELPTLATAVTADAWYAWVSPAVIEGGGRSLDAEGYSTRDLIPLESDGQGRAVDPERPRVVVGHNVSYDRAHVREQYRLQPTATRFLDTMSLHVCVSGVTSYQRAMLKSKEYIGDSELEKWRESASLNSLSEVHKLYCGGEVDKSSRDVFLTGKLSDVKLHFQDLMRYCAGDVTATHGVLCKLLPLFLERFPHPVTLAGMLELGTAFLPVNANWFRYISDANQTFEELDDETRFLLTQRADRACHLLHDEKYKEDLWLWDQDWQIQELRLKKTAVRSKPRKTSNSKEHVDSEKNQLEVEEKKFVSGETPTDVIETEEMCRLKEEFQTLWETKDMLPKKRPLMPGYPAWYRKLCLRMGDEDWVPGPQRISTSMQITPKLLSLTWETYPLHYIREFGWGLLIPYRTSIEDSDDLDFFPLKKLVERCSVPNLSDFEAGSDQSVQSMVHLHKSVEDNISWRNFRRKKASANETPSWYGGTGVWCNADVAGCCWFLKLPHKDGTSHRVGNPLAKDFLNKFSENVLAGNDAGAEKVLLISRMLSYWRNNRERICQQRVVWSERKELPRNLRCSVKSFGAILPQVVVCGTLTRRAVEPTWMTASNAHKERIGSELRAMVQAPPGYNIVGADVDSQELWIASLMGDAHFGKMHGCTPLGWMTLSGQKSNGTDMHSITAKAVGISRDHAKVINYARIYGAGQQFAERLLKQFNPAMSTTEARNKASKMFTMTKGRKVCRLKERYRHDLNDKPYSVSEALKIGGKHGLAFDEMFDGPRWAGGSESAMFNCLEAFANRDEPVTPFLGGRLSRALEPGSVPDDRYLPTRVNWVVQSGAVDFLHLMLVSMRWLLGPSARFCLSFHDEVRYLVPSELRYQAALALHVTNLLTRAFCSQRLGVADLPRSVAFFSSVEVDTALRKEARDDCVTPSNPHGLLRGHGVGEGESLDIHEALAKAGGRLSVPRRHARNKTKHLKTLCVK